MLNTDENKILFGNSIDYNALDNDYNIEDDFDEDHVGEIAIRDYYFSILSNRINTDEFKEYYLGVKNEIKKYPLKDRLDFCYFLIKKIEDEYEFEIPKHLYPTNQNSIDYLFNFIEFIEYDNEDFLLEIWYYLKLDDISKIKEACIKQSDKIILEIEEILTTQYFNEFISFFLRTYYKEGMIEWFSKKSENIKYQLKINMLKE